MVIPVGADGTRAEGKGRSACTGPLGLPPARSVLNPLFLCFVINQSTHSLLLPAREEEVGPAGLGGAGRPGTRPKIFEFFL